MFCREVCCIKGFFFVCFELVLKRIKVRFGGKFFEYFMVSGMIIFYFYDFGV